MVIRASNRRGSSSTGCLLTMLIFSAVLYYGINIGEVYWRFYQYQDEMRSQARLAPSLADGVIRRRLLLTVDRLGLPAEAQRIQIKRTSRPRQITIEAEYEEAVRLPLFNHTFHFRPRAVEGL
ncbi:MAG: hypothetical protein E4H41_00765 [Gemmatimonadales bacterium]|jgi:hypothetical protein|nr:MAG: hypothetical protein E4H41_00765 [Gemmatimonadales bacterium]